MKCLTCNISWFDPENNFKGNNCPFCDSDLSLNTQVTKGFEIKDNILLRYSGEGGHVIIPNFIEEIGYGAFAYCRNLHSISLFDNVQKIGNWSFYECQNLASIKLSNSITTIGDSAFLRCTSLNQIILPNSVNTINNRAFTYCDNLPNDIKTKINQLNSNAI